MKVLPIQPAAVLVIMLSIACSDDPVQNQVSADDLVDGVNAVNFSRGVASGHRHIAMLDDCDASDPAWNATGGCASRRGSVTNAEFNSFVASPHSSAVIGHPAWTNDPTYLKTGPRRSFRVTNDGGRAHTFTKVANYGGGRVPPLNLGMTPAPECLLAPGAVDPFLVPPGGKMDVEGLAAGNHRFQCCFHPWMRTLIKVQ